MKQQKKDVDLTNKIIDFFYLRIKTILIDKGIDYDVVDALRDSAFKNLNATLVFARDLQDYKQVNNVRLKLISETAVRIARLAKKATDKNLDCDLFVENIERELYDDYLKLQKLNLLNFDHYYSFSLTFNKYFDQILVMSDNLNLKMNRLAFLKKCDSFYNKLADFEKLII